MSQLLNLKIDQIVVLDQIRSKSGFDHKSIGELSASILAHGLIEPLVVHHQNGVYTLVAGERRFRAARLANLKTVDCVVRELDQNSCSTAIQTVENIQRENLALSDLVHGVDTLFQIYKTNKAVAGALSKSQSWVSKHLNLSKIQPENQLYEAIQEGWTQDIELFLLLQQLERLDQDSFLKQLVGLKTGFTTRATVQRSIQKFKQDGKEEASQVKESGSDSLSTEKKDEVQPFLILTSQERDLLLAALQFSQGSKTTIESLKKRLLDLPL